MHLHNFREMKCLQGYSKTLWMNKRNFKISYMPTENSLVIINMGPQPSNASLILSGGKYSILLL